MKNSKPKHTNATTKEVRDLSLAAKILDGLPVPTKGRYAYRPETGEFIGPFDEDQKGE